MFSNISPDGKWKIVIEDNKVHWTKLTNNNNTVTIQEIVEATKNIGPDTWKK